MAIDRDAAVEVRVNQLGYPAGRAKRCVAPADAGRFELRQLPDDRTVASGETRPAGGDFGEYRVGAFGDVRAAGQYYVRAGEYRSVPFRIGAPYRELVPAIVEHFGRQRCGPSTTGYLAPCHCDDGLRDDTGERVDVTGGWHDATDLRKWVGATVQAMVGLAGLLREGGPVARTRVLDELRWGNRYFLAMQDEAGYVMNHVGGDLLEHGDSNRWTDNDPDDPDGDLHLVSASRGIEAAVFGSGDDRVVDTDPVGAAAQFDFVDAEATLARRLPDGEGERCLDAATDCLDWCLAEGVAATPADHASIARATASLYRTTGADRHREHAAAAARDLLDAQVGESGPGPAGYFTHDGAPFRDVVRGHQPLLGLCALLETFPDHPDAGAWREGLRAYAGFLAEMTERNAFGVVPLGLYGADESPGGDRRVAGLPYRYFMRPEGWWVGTNATLAVAGVGLLRAGRLLDRPEWRALAGRQLDWVLGANPLGASTVEGFGRGHPGRFETSEFDPQTPRSRGGVMNGLGGTGADTPARYDGSYHTAEYWTPMCAYVLWLAAALRR